MRRRIFIVQVDHLHALGPFEYKFVVPDRPIDVHRFNRESDVILLFGSPNLDMGRKPGGIKILLVAVTNVGYDSAGAIIQQLAIG